VDADVNNFPFETESLPRGAFLYFGEGIGHVSLVGTPPNTTSARHVTRNVANKRLFRGERELLSFFSTISLKLTRRTVEELYPFS